MELLPILRLINQAYGFFLIFPTAYIFIDTYLKFKSQPASKRKNTSNVFLTIFGTILFTVTFSTVLLTVILHTEIERNTVNLLSNIRILIANLGWTAILVGVYLIRSDKL